MKRLIPLIIIVLLGVSPVYFLSLRAVDAHDEVRKTVNVESGWSVGQIAAMLEEEGLIRSPFAFKLYTKLHGLQNDLQAGQFVLKPSMSTSEVIDVMRTGEAEELIITIPEGYTVKDIDALMVEKGLSQPGDITRCAQECDFSEFAFLSSSGELAKRGGKVEGYLYPDTYFVLVQGFTPESFLKRLLGTFESKVVQDLATDLKASSRSLEDIVTMASLIEEEAAHDDERATIAGILWKRFDGGMGLGVDATVRYIVDKQSDAITTADLDIDNAYNTRKFRGLPPGPIANPGIRSIQAALKPEASAYLFYLHDPKGQIHYAETNDQHNENRAKYL